MVSPRDWEALLRLGLDLYDPADAALFVDGVRAADDAIAAQERWGRAAVSPSKRVRSPL
ncbi:hypothetical protein WME79_06405 [Sorangium sp. So ce726]|uniref:hypothetical protein n=1 Tax=Sorangium sp. So ce726 TaxID=3133319 RepID=UPI003F5F2586